MIDTSRSNLEILLECSQVLPLLRWGLVSTMAEFRRGVNPFKVDLLESSPACVYEQGLPEGNDSLLGARDGTLDHNEVVLDLTVADESTETVTELVGKSFPHE